MARSKGELFGLSHLIPLMFFHPLSSSRSYLFRPAKSQPQRQGHLAYVLVHTHILMFTHSGFISTYLWDDEDHSVCAFAKPQSKQFPMK